MGILYVFYAGLIFVGALAGYGLFSLLVFIGIPANVLLTLLGIFVGLFFLVGFIIAFFD